MASLLRIAAAAFLTLAAFGALAAGAELGVLRSRAAFLLVAVPLTLLCLYAWRRKPEDGP